MKPVDPNHAGTNSLYDQPQQFLQAARLSLVLSALGRMRGHYQQKPKRVGLIGTGGMGRVTYFD